LPEKRHQHLLLDQIIELKNEASKEKYPKSLRRIVIWDEVNQQKIELITHHTQWAASTIAQLYKCRWQVEMRSIHEFIIK